MDFRASLRTWIKILSNPNVATFEDELQQPHANMATAGIWMFAAGLVAVLVWMLIFLLIDPISQSLELTSELLTDMNLGDDIVAETVESMEATATLTMVMMLCSLLIGIPVLFFVWSGALWLVARAFGGGASYDSQTYLLASFTAPLIMLSMIIYVLPILGLVFILLLNIYALYLTYIAIMTSHQLPAGRAATSLLVPLLGGFLFACCALTVWLAGISAALGAV